MWGIAQANGISLSQLESLNPQIANPRVIVPGETINLGSGGTGDSGSSSSGSSSAASGSGSTYTVVHGDTLSGIAAANGMTTSQIEALNPQFKDPDLIFPGQSVNLGGGGTGAAADPTQAVVSQTQATSPSSSTGTSTDSNNDSSDGGISSDSSSSGGGAIGFPEKSSYPFGTIGSEAEKALSGITPTAQAAGWVSGAESESTDIAKQVFEAGANQSSTDPLKINDVKDQSSSH
jgi:LysM repeat protein